MSDVCVGKGIGDASFSVHSSSKSMRNVRGGRGGTLSSSTTKRSSKSTASTPPTSITNADGTNKAIVNLGKAIWHVNQHLRASQPTPQIWRPYRMQIHTTACSTQDSQLTTIMMRSIRKFQPLVVLPPAEHMTWLQHSSTRKELPGIKYSPHILIYIYCLLSVTAATMVTHSPWTAVQLNKHARRTEEMLRVRAFIHWYVYSH